MSSLKLLMIYCQLYIYILGLSKKLEGKDLLTRIISRIVSGH